MYLDKLPVVYREVCRAFSSRDYLRPIPSFRHAYAEYGRVTDGARTRDLRSHNPYEQFRMRPTRSRCVAYLSRITYIRGAGHPRVSGCVLASIAAALLPFSVFRQHSPRELSIAFYSNDH